MNQNSMDKSDFFLQPELLDEAPRFWLSRRWRLAVLGCFGFLIVTSNRIGVEVALLCMLNRTSTNVSTTHPLTARFPDQIGIVNPAWRVYSSLSVQQLGHSIASGSVQMVGSGSYAGSGGGTTEVPRLHLDEMSVRGDPGVDEESLAGHKRRRRSMDSTMNATKAIGVKPEITRSGPNASLSSIPISTTKQPISRGPTTTTQRTNNRRLDFSVLTTNASLTTSMAPTEQFLSSELSQTTDSLGAMWTLSNLTTVFLHGVENATHFHRRDNFTVGGVSKSGKCEFWNATTYSFLDTDLLSVPENGDRHWTREEHTAIWEAYYIGDFIVRLPSAFLAQRFGGRNIFAVAVFVESVCTALVPLASKLHYFPVLLLRLFTGMSAGFTTPAMYYMLGRWAPADERCLLLAIINTGGWISGCAVVLPLSCLLCTYGFEGGWSSVFYVFGGFGMLWCVLWMLFTSDTPSQDGSIPREERDYIVGSIKLAETVDSKYEALRCTHTPWLAPLSAPISVFMDDTDHTTTTANDNDNDNDGYRNHPKSSATGLTSTGDQQLKWPVVLTSVQLLVLTCTEFTHEWIILTFFSVLPTYNNIILNFAIDEYSVAFIMPCAGFWFAMMMTAGAADRLHSYGVLPVTHVRKIMNSVGSVISSCMLLAIMFIGCNQRRGLLYISILGLSFAGIQYSGALVAPLDLSSKYSAVLVGISGIARASVRFIVPPFAALLLRYNQDTGHVDDFVSHAILSKRNSNSSTALGVQNKTQWYILFVVTACCHLATALMYLLVGTGHHQSQWMESTEKSVRPSAKKMEPDPLDHDHQEKRNAAKVTTSRRNVAQHVPPRGSLTMVSIPSRGEVADVGYTQEPPSRMISSPKEALVSDNSFISTNTSFEEPADVERKNCRLGGATSQLIRNRSLADHLSSATMATVDSTSANFSLCSSPTASAPAKFSRSSRASFTLESSSDNRNGDDYYDYDDDEEYDDGDSGSSVRHLSRNLRNSLVMESDLSESAV